METGPRRVQSRTAARPPRGRARTPRPLLPVALGAACLFATSLRLPPASAAGSGAGYSLQGLQLASRRTVAHRAALELGAVGAGEAKDIDLSQFAGEPTGKWFEGRVDKLLFGHGAFVVVEVPGSSKVGMGLLKRDQFGEGMIDSINPGMKVKVRVLACNAEKGWLFLMAKERSPRSSSSSGSSRSSSGTLSSWAQLTEQRTLPDASELWGEAAGAGEAAGLQAAGAGEEQTTTAPPKVALADLKVGQTLEGRPRRSRRLVKGRPRGSRLLVPEVALADLRVGQTLEGTVIDHCSFGAFVNVGAERAGLVEVREFPDGLQPRLEEGTKVVARVLKVEAGKLWLTLRSGDLARPSGDISPEAWKHTDLSPFVGVPADQSFDGEVQSFWLDKGAFVVVEVPGTNKLARGLLKKEEFGEGMIDSIHLGMKVRVRVLACDTEKGRLDVTAKDP